MENLDLILRLRTEIRKTLEALTLSITSGSVDNIESYLSDQTHIYANRKFLLSAYSLKWIYKRVKRNPNLTFQQLHLKGCQL